MAKFATEPKLTEEEKDYLVKELKPLLKQNDMISVRDKLRSALDNYDDYIDNNIDVLNISSFLLYHLGEDKYFEKSRSIYSFEFQGFDDLVSVTIPEGIAFIGICAFRSCYKLKDVKLPSTLKKIGYDAFSWCNIESISIPEGVTFLDEFTFRGCDKLSHIDLPNSITAIPQGMFVGCEKLKSIDIPSSVKKVDMRAFTNCSITSITIPKDCEVIWHSDIEIIRR